MGLPGTFFTFVDRVSSRKMSARIASFIYGLSTGGRRRFSEDSSGRWVNQQPEATIVSPIVHTTSYAAFRRWVIDNWCWGYMVREGDTVIDVGAGIGEEAVILSSLVGPKGRVISIEAHPETFACLQETLRRSELANVVPLHLALSDCDGIATIASGTSHLTSSIMTGGAGSTVPARSLDSLSRQFGWTNVALLKMNIEGAELAAVRGMALLSQRITNVCISCHDFLADRGGGEALRTRAKVEPLLERYKFKLVSRPGHPDPWVRDYLYGQRSNQ